MVAPPLIDVSGSGVFANASSLKLRNGDETSIFKGLTTVFLRYSISIFPIFSKLPGTA
jgi:hypothetical protein